MGWASGSEIFIDIAYALKKEFPGNVGTENYDKRKKFYVKAIKAFESQDWDTQTECYGCDSALDSVLNDKYPEEE